MKLDKGCSKYICLISDIIEELSILMDKSLSIRDEEALLSLEDTVGHLRDVLDKINKLGDKDEI